MVDCQVLGTLTRGWRGDTADLDAEVLTDFLARLQTLDTTGQRVLGRLLDAAIRAGSRRADADGADTVRVDEATAARSAVRSPHVASRRHPRAGPCRRKEISPPPKRVGAQNPATATRPAHIRGSSRRAGRV
jgi:hypothetical protein